LRFFSKGYDQGFDKGAKEDILTLEER